MSKISGLPTQKGTELFPTNTQAPTKLVIDGVEPGSAEARMLADRFSEQIKKFHVKQRQLYALSPNEQQKGFTKWDGGSATYINNQGQETIHVKVTGKVRTKPEKKVEPCRKEFMLITIKIPEMEGATTTMFAVMTVPFGDYAHNDEAQANSGEPVRLTCPTYSAAYPPFYEGTFSSVTSDGSELVTVLVDMRTELQDLPITLDFYSNIYRTRQDGQSCRVGGQILDVGGSTEDISYETIHEWYHLIGYVEPFHFPPFGLTYPDDYYIPVAAAPENENWGTFDTITHRTYVPGPSPTQYSQITTTYIDQDFLGYVRLHRGLPGDTWEYEWFRVKMTTGVVNYAYVPYYVYNGTTSRLSRTAEVHAQLYDPGGKISDFGIVHHTRPMNNNPGGNCPDYMTGGQDFRTIVRKKDFPAQPPGSKLGQVIIDDVVPPDHHVLYNPVYRFTVVYDPTHCVAAMNTLGPRP